MNKAFHRINWENTPSVATPINETNLNAGDEALDTIDDRVITLDTTKANQSDLLTTVSDVSLNETTGVITITWKNGTTRTYDTALEKVVTNFTYDSTTQSLILTYPDGTTESISLTSFITQYEFTDTSTIDFTVAQDGTVSAIVKDGSITGTQLQPNYLADVTTQATNAVASATQAVASATSASTSATSASTSATSASTSADLAESYAVGTNGTVRQGDATDNAKYYSEQAASSATSASQNATTVLNTKDAIDIIKTQIDSAATQVHSDASTASTAATQASASATQAAGSASSAAADAQRAEDAAEEAAAIVGISVMTPSSNGIGRPDDVTIQADSTGVISVKKDYALNSSLTSHTGSKISDTNGVHGIKYNEISKKLQIQKQDSTWVDYEGGGSGGHTIKNSSGTALTQRTNLQFTDLSVTDDSTNDATIVSAEQKIDKTELISLSTTGTQNTTGAVIPKNTFFYLNGVLVKALVDIGVNSSYIENTNYSTVTKGALNEVVTEIPIASSSTLGGVKVGSNLSITNAGVLTANEDTTKANKTTIAPEFDSTTSYSVGDLVYYQSILYKCTTAHTGAWNASHFTTTTVSNNLLKAVVNETTHTLIL